MSKNDGVVLEKEFSKSSRPSWQRHGEGHASLKLMAHKEAGWLQIIVGEAGEKSYRSAYITLDAPEVQELQNFLASFASNQPNVT